VCLTAHCAKGTVYIDAETGEVSYKPGVMDQVHGTAYGYYNNTLNETGWAVLEIRTAQGRVAINNQLMFAAGYLEGVLTARYCCTDNFVTSRVKGCLYYDTCTAYMYHSVNTL